MTKDSIQPFFFTPAFRAKGLAIAARQGLVFLQQTHSWTTENSWNQQVSSGHFGSDIPGQALLRAYSAAALLQIAALSNRGANTSAIAAR
jgi:hypothetical protein